MVTDLSPELRGGKEGNLPPVEPPIDLGHHRFFRGFRYGFIVNLVTVLAGGTVLHIAKPELWREVMTSPQPQHALIGILALAVLTAANSAAAVLYNHRSSTS